MQDDRAPFHVKRDVRRSNPKEGYILPELVRLEIAQYVLHLVDEPVVTPVYGG